MKADHGAISAARTYLRAHLGWLRGFPISNGKGGFVWQTVPGLGIDELSAKIKVDRERVRKSAFAMNRVQAKFPKAFEHVVGNADDWQRRMEWRIGCFKNVIHDGNALPNLGELLVAVSARKGALKRAEDLTNTTKLTGLVKATLWVCLQDRADLDQRLSVIENNAKFFDVLVSNNDVVAALNLIDFVCEGVGKKLLASLGDVDLWATPTTTGGHVKKLKQYLSVFQTTGELDSRFTVEGLDVPAANSAQILIGFLDKTVRLNAGTRRLRMSLLEEQFDPAVTKLWQQWWRDIGLLERDIRRELSGPMPLKERRAAVKTYRQRLQLCQENTPLLSYTQTAAENAAILAEHNELARELVALSTELALPPAHFHTLVSAWRSDRPLVLSSKVLDEVIAGLRILLPEMPSEIATTGSILESIILDLDDHWVTGAKPVALLKPWFQAIVAWIKQDRENDRRNVDSYLFYSLLTVVEKCPSDTVAAKVMDAVSEWRPDEELLVVLLDLADGDQGVFEALAKTFQAKEDAVDLATILRWLAATPEIKLLIIEALKAGESKVLRRIALLAQLARSLKCPAGLPQKQAQPFDSSPYPAVFHVQLEDLAIWDENVSSAVDSILGTDYPLPKRIRSELDMLRQLVRERPNDAGSLSIRIAKLEEKLSQPQLIEITEIKQAKYQRKLAARLRHAKFASWEAKLLRELKDALAREQLDDLADMLAQSDALEVLWAISDLKGSMRHLGWRLIKERLGPPPWDLREALENKAFIEKLGLNGVDASPWLDGIAPQLGAIGSFRVELKLEDDPLQVMRMGAPFQTCLAPGSFNFFSAVSNAADINKRVLYARDPGGGIRARCLLCLTDAGEIVAFNVYSHDHLDDATELVTEFVQILAAAMNTITVPRGKIRRLVASNWYDDGPRDLTGQLEAIRKGSPFDRSLPDLAASDFVDALGKALNRAAVTPAIFETLVGLDNFRNRPDFIEPLLPRLEQTGLEAYTCAALSNMAFRAGHTDVARDMLDKAAKRIGDEDIFGVVQLANEYTQIGTPQRALQLLRRHADVLSDWSNATVARASALEKLYRPRQALDAYRLAEGEGAVVSKEVLENLERQLQN